MATVTTTVGNAEDQQVKAQTSIEQLRLYYPYAGYLLNYVIGKQPPLEQFEHQDVGLKADAAKAALLSAPGANFEDIAPAVGTEVHGLQLSSLTDQQKDELALLAAERGIVIFRDQDFADIGPQKQQDFAAYFGPLHIHNRGGQVKGYPGLLPVCRDFEAGTTDNEILNKGSSIKWHSDMTYELNPPGTTFFMSFYTPKSGGDTLYLSATAAYDSLSDAYKARIDGLWANHSGFEQYQAAAHKERYVRDPIETWHPVVRTHPVTKRKSLWVNRLYTRKIRGMTDEESASILNFLFNHIEFGQEWHVRAKWSPRTVVVYDNRVTQHSAVRDERFQTEGADTRRHMMRMAPQAEKPYFDGTAGVIEASQKS